MTKLIHSLLLLLVMSITPFTEIVSKEEKISHNRLRTDGFYFYDNGVDSLVITPEGKSLFKEISNEMIQKGLCPPAKSRCIPDSVFVEAMGSSYLHYTAFFSDSTGTAFGSNCRDSATIAESIEKILTRKVGGDTSCFLKYEMIHKMRFINDSTFRFFVQDDDFFKEIELAVVKGDSLKVTDIVNAEYERPNSKRHYFFIPFDHIPTDLGKIKH